MVEAIKSVPIGSKSRLRLWLLRVFFRPLVSFIARMPEERIVTIQLRAAAELEQRPGLPSALRIVGNVPSTVVGDPQKRQALTILYLHGGAFIFPASRRQFGLLAKLCQDLDAIGFMPDYRLAPLHPAPAALDDCERCYRELLQQGHAPERIVLIGESAGGNLVLGLLQRIRKAGLAMPLCAVPISPVTELARIQALPSRRLNSGRDALVPPALFARSTIWYTRGHDASHPEISPLYADYAGFPPLHFVAGDSESLRDDSVFAAQRAREAGVETELSVWPVLPHAFPIFEDLFVEARQARREMVEFIQRQAGARA
jgi:epsilon-lactone hydrolase